MKLMCSVRRNVRLSLLVILTASFSILAIAQRLQLMLDSCQQIHVVGRKPAFQPITARLLLYPRSLGVAIISRDVRFTSVSSKHDLCSKYVRCVPIDHKSGRLIATYIPQNRNN